MLPHSQYHELYKDDKDEEPQEKMCTYNDDEKEIIDGYYNADTYPQDLIDK